LFYYNATLAYLNFRKIGHYGNQILTKPLIGRFNHIDNNYYFMVLILYLINMIMKRHATLSFGILIRNTQNIPKSIVKCKCCKEVYKDFFKRSFKISDGRIKRALVNKVVGSTPPKDASGKSGTVNKLSNEKCNEVINFIKKFPVSTSH